MTDGFREGYEYFQKHAGAAAAALHGGEFGAERAAYVAPIVEEIEELERSINDFIGDNTPIKQLKGNIAEFWHAGTYNVNAAQQQIDLRAKVYESNAFGSVDVAIEKDGYSIKDFGLKYYSTGMDSAKQQAKSVFERFMEYQKAGGKDSIEKFLEERHYTSEDILNDPIYSGQTRVIPHDQLEEAKKWLLRKIATEGAKRPEQVKRYQDTYDMLRDRISDKSGIESKPLDRADAERIAEQAKKGEFDAEEYGITAPELLNLEMVVKESLRAGVSAAVISLVLKVGPEIFKTIDYLVKNGEINDEQFKEIGFAAVTGSSEGFIRGTMAAAITTCCKSGILGEALKEVSPGIVGAMVAVTMNTMKNAYQVANGKKSRAELTDELIRDMFVSSSALVLGYAGQVVLHQLPVIGYMIGSFVGSVVGSFVYSTGYKTALSFCTETGVTLFGIVDQDYRLPDDIIEEMGLETFDYETFSTDTFEPDTFAFDTFEPETIQPDTLGITFLRRGVIGVARIGYAC